jgi:hypothetical protein
LGLTDSRPLRTLTKRRLAAAETDTVKPNKRPIKESFIM